MTRDRHQATRLRPDFVLLVGYAVVSPAIELVEPGSAIRLLLVLPLAFFIPGYFATMALFPEAHHSVSGGYRWLTLGMAERLALSFGLSTVVLPLYALGAWGFGPTTPELGVAHLGVLTLGLAAIALVRLNRTPIEHRYRPDITGAMADSLATVRSYPRGHQLAMLVLVLAVVSAGGMFAIALAMPQDGETFTEFLVGTETPDGDFVLSGYPESIASDEAAEYQLLIRNHESQALTYVIHIELHRLEGGEVIERETMDELEVTLGDGESTRLDTAIRPTMHGDGLRLTFSLYTATGSIDGEPDQRLHLWVDVVES